MFRIRFAAVEKDGGLDRDLFTNMYLMFLGSQDNPNRAQSLEETRLAIKVLDAFDAVSEIQSISNGAGIRILNPNGGDLRLSSEEKSLLMRSIDNYLSTVPFALARLGIKVKDKVEGAERESGVSTA